MLSKKIITLLVCSIVVFPMISLASAGTATGLSGFRIGANPSDKSGQADLGTTVYIYWDGGTPSGGTIDITIHNPAGAEIATYPGVALSASGTLSFVCNTPGTYYVQADGYPSYHAITTFVAGASILVTPESALGPAMALGAGLAAFGAIGVVKRRNLKAKKA